MCVEQLNKLTSTLLQLSDIEEELDALPNKQSEEDSKISDILHYLEKNSISTNGAYGIVRELKAIQIERRGTKQLIEINRVYKSNQEKLKHTENRKMLVAELNKTYKGLLNDYKPRIYTQEELDTIAKKGGIHNEE